MASEDTKPLYELSDSLLLELVWAHQLQKIQRYILHDVSNCLTGSLALSELYCKNDSVEKLQEALITIRNNGYRERNLLLLSSQLSHAQAELNQVDVVHFFEQIKPLLSCILPAQVALTLDIKALGQSFVLAFNPEHLQRIFLQIILNANEALKETEKPAFSILNAVENGQWVCTIMDNGHGMSEETVMRLQPPFLQFPRGEDHLGLGLHMVYTYLSSAQGALNISSQVDQGTTVVLRLPYIV